MRFILTFAVTVFVGLSAFAQGGSSYKTSGPNECNTGDFSRSLTKVNFNQVAFKTTLKTTNVMYGWTGYWKTGIVMSGPCKGKNVGCWDGTLCKGKGSEGCDEKWCSL